MVVMEVRGLSRALRVWILLIESSAQASKPAEDVRVVHRVLARLHERAGLLSSIYRYAISRSTLLLLVTATASCRV
jgi:hypothetical protein